MTVQRWMIGVVALACLLVGSGLATAQEETTESDDPIEQWASTFN